MDVQLAVMAIFQNSWFTKQVWLYLLELQPSVDVGASIWTQILSVLLVGLLTAFAFQLLLTNLGIAIAISRFRGQSPEENAFLDEQTEKENSVAGVGFMAGFGLLITVNTVLFIACFLAVKFAKISEPTSGAIAGIVIWSAYFLLLIWISATAVNTIVGSVLETTFSGFRRLVSTITAAFKTQQNQPIKEEQARELARQEIASVLDSVQLQQTLAPSVSSVTTGEVWQKVESYLITTPTKKLTPKRIDRQIQKMLHDEETRPQCDRLILNQWLDQRQDLSDKQKKRIINQIEATWQDYQQEPLQSESNAVEEDSPLSPIQASLLKAALSKTIEQALTNLPEMLNAGEQDKLSKSVEEDTSAGALATYAEGFRDTVMQPLETAQIAVQERIDRLKVQAQQQVEATRKAAAVACWWLLAIALTGSVSSAVAGMLATGYISYSTFK